MKWINHFFILLSFSIVAQEPIETSLVSNSKLDAESIVAIDPFDAIFYIQDNAIIFNRTSGPVEYSNVQLGYISSANAFNPLKINLFYKDFNTIVILDNRLAEIFKIDFNAIQPYKNITHISTGNDNTLWLFNQDTQQLEVYDYLNNKVRAKTLPINSAILDLKSNFNFCWLLTENYIYCYNYFGSLISKIKNEGYTVLSQSNGNLVLKKDNTLYYLKKGSTLIQKIELPELLINQFLLTNESLYIYNDEILQKFQLKIK